MTHSEEQIRQELKKVAYRFADACVEKAMLRLKEHPDRSPTPWLDFDIPFLRKRLLEESREWFDLLGRRKFRFESERSELEDIGNFSAWLWYHVEELP